MLQGGNAEKMRTSSELLPQAQQKADILVSGSDDEKIGIAGKSSVGGERQEQDLVDPAVLDPRHKKVGDRVSSGDPLSYGG